VGAESGIPLAPNGVRVVRFGGLSFALRQTPRESLVSDRAAFTQVCLVGEYSELLSLVDTGDAVIDCGANIGIFSLLAAQKVGPDGLVISVEPEPANFGMLLRNIGLNGFRNVTPVRAALHHTPGLTLAVHGGGVGAKVRPKGDRRVETVSLPSLLSPTSTRRTFIKMDIEGAEREVFEDPGIGKVLQETTAIAIELHELRSTVTIPDSLRASGMKVTTSGNPARGFGVVIPGFPHHLKGTLTALSLYASDAIRHAAALSVFILRSSVDDRTFRPKVVLGQR
jgi:FkbM family methyltransferase